MHNDKIILFPRTKEQLLNQLNKAIKENNYKEALQISNTLITNNITSEQIYLTKLNCLIHLKQLNEAEEFCEALLDSTSHYNEQYLEYYLFILYELNKFHILIEAYEKAKSNSKITQVNQIKLDSFYELAKQLNEKEIDKYSKLLEKARIEQNYTLQWQAILNLKRISKMPNEWLSSILVDKKMHPVVKTKIIIWLQESDVCDEIKVEKFGEIIQFIPNDLLHLKKQDAYIRVKENIHFLEQKDPSLYHFAHQLLYHYFYVIYPIIIPLEETNYIAEAILNIATKKLFLHNKKQENKSINKYESDIQICNELYLNIIDSI